MHAEKYAITRDLTLLYMYPFQDMPDLQMSKTYHISLLFYIGPMAVALRSRFQGKGNLLPRTHRDAQRLEITFSHVT